MMSDSLENSDRTMVYVKTSRTILRKKYYFYEIYFDISKLSWGELQFAPTDFHYNSFERQAQIIKAYYDDRNLISTVKDFQIKFMISPTTAKSDIRELLNLKILKEISFNRVKKGYIIGEEFDNMVK